ncbi:MAG: glycosyltransferase [Planctomycetes bacterium]|nr:glycosyltransferase [Planctomycetota bacterium]
MMMKILFYSYAYPNALNPGLGTFNRAMIAGLSTEHEVRVVSPVSFVETWGAALKRKLPRGLNDPQFSAVPNVPAEYLTSYYTPKILRSQYGRWMWWSVARRLNRTMKSFKPDVVLSYWAHPDGEVAVRMAHRHGVPAVVMAGGSDVLVLGRNGKRQQKILNVMHNADAVVTVSEDIAATLSRDGVDPRKVRVVRRGVDRSIFSPGERMVARRGLEIPENATVLVSVGRLVPVKGHCHLLQACRLLAARRVPFRCYIIGDGPLKADLQRQITQLGLEGSVELKGNQTQNQLAEWYRAADVTVLPSNSEGVPNVLLESIACGTPFVASDVGGIQEIADSRHDRLVPPASPVALADAIEWQLKVRRFDLPPRAFEPLALKAAARRLTQIIEDVRGTVKRRSSKWYAFGQPKPESITEATPVESACSVQNSLPAASSAITRPVTSMTEETQAPDAHWHEELCLPSTNFFASELGRTGEEFVLPKM